MKFNRVSRQLGLLGISLILPFLMIWYGAQSAALSVSSVTSNGRQITVKSAGGGSQQIETINGQTVIKSDGHYITVNGRQINVNGNYRRAPSFQKMVIHIDGRRLTIVADGQRIWP